MEELAEMGKLWIAATRVAFPLLNCATCEKQFGVSTGQHPKKFNFAMTYNWISDDSFPVCRVP
jgi:hypothetical protein